MAEKPGTKPRNNTVLILGSVGLGAAVLLVLLWIVLTAVRNGAALNTLNTGAGPGSAPPVAGPVENPPGVADAPPGLPPLGEGLGPDGLPPDSAPPVDAGAPPGVIAPSTQATSAGGPLPLILASSALFISILALITAAFALISTRSTER